MNGENRNPFSFRLEKSVKNTEGAASAWLDFHPTCENCGLALNRKEYRVKEPPTIPRKCPQFICPRCNITTKYNIQQMYDALTDFHNRYPTKVLLERGIKSLDFITTSWIKKDEADT